MQSEGEEKKTLCRSRIYCNIRWQSVHLPTNHFQRMNCFNCCKYFRIKSLFTSEKYSPLGVEKVGNKNASENRTKLKKITCAESVFGKLGRYFRNSIPFNCMLNIQLYIQRS